jgi:hypothetical protein
MNARQRLVMNLVQAALKLEEAEENAKKLASIQNRMRVVEAFDHYREFEQRAIKEINDIEELQRCIAAGIIFLNILNSL